MLMLINGSIAATTDPKVVEYNVFNNPNCKAIFVGDTVGYENMISYYHILVASPLVPDYSVMEADIEGSPWEFSMKYRDYLQNQQATQYFITILAALHMGKFILLFFPPESNGLNYPSELLRFMNDVYGITAAYPEMGLPYMYNPRFDDFDANMMYSYNLMTPEDYLQYVTPQTINYQKVAMDLRLPIRENTSFESVSNWILQYRDRILKANKPLLKPFMLEVHDANTN